jgi:hypothetical protein
MKPKRTGRLQQKVTSTRGISVPAPARLPACESFRSSPGEGAALNLWIFFGLAVFFFGLSFATLAMSDPGWGAFENQQPLSPWCCSFSTRSKLLGHPTADVELDIIVVDTISGVQYNRSLKKTPRHFGYEKQMHC